MAINMDFEDWSFICHDGGGLWKRWSGPWSKETAEDVVRGIKTLYPKRSFTVLPGRFIGLNTWDDKLKDFIHDDSALTVQKAPWDD